MSLMELYEVNPSLAAIKLLIVLGLLRILGTHCRLQSVVSWPWMTRFLVCIANSTLILVHGCLCAAGLFVQVNITDIYTAWSRTQFTTSMRQVSDKRTVEETKLATENGLALLSACRALVGRGLGVDEGHFAGKWSRILWQSPARIVWQLVLIATWNMVV